jgi:hypothetical protein|tara:strand:- start:308 stop:940 length:633 start_codon:yes stop_codon:yes gene_type:complete
MVEISKNKLSELIINPKQISLEETFALNNIIKEYPYFQAGRILELIGLKKHNSIRFNKVLKDCSLFSTDRGVLRDIIELDEIVVKRKNNKPNDVILSSQKTKNSFIEWLKVTKPVFKELNSKNETLIQDFLKSKPIISLKSKTSNTNLANEFKLSKKEYMTETLAKLYFEQNKFKDAIKAYEILCLKYPEKISLFADQINAIKNSLKNKK